MSSPRVEQVTDDEFLAFARLSGHPVPIEQAPAWDPFDTAVGGREHVGRFAVWLGSSDDTPDAVVSLSRYVVRGFPYLWAKHGPILIGEPTAERELAVRQAIAADAAARFPDAVFIRLHARHAAADLKELLQTVTYDHTVIIDLTPPEEQILAGFSKRGRYKTRQTLKDEAMTVTDESDITPEAFAELYDIYRETAQRDEFGIFPAEMYLTMLETLRGHIRLWVARRHDTGPDGDLTPGRAVSWVISIVHDGGGVDYYAAGNLEARNTNAAIRLKWHIVTTLKAEGVTQYDLMGVGSDRAPQLMGVREFKQQFGDIVECDGAWDLPLKPVRYRLLVAALSAKRALRR